ncbi:hypothetical protein JCGZ_26571 [Jatropha curcas]|uniref:Uncharacterized protein n=1 Tax=Jatropha curcas TaxID=180498 RepID=A0A067JXX5_JATCU|nr:hypothetical protein JCGZ_26571 [Jatropha curcas]
MSQISKIPASAYTPEMETLGALPDIPTFDGEPVPVSRNPPTPGNPRDTTVAASAVARYGVPGQVRDEPDARLSVRGLRQESRHAGRSCVARQVGVAWRSCSSMNSCVTQLFLNEQLRDATVRGTRNPSLP